MREPVDWPTRDLLSHRRATTPERTAVVDAASGREWTYRELDTFVDGVTARLQSLFSAGETSDRIGLLADTSVDFVTVVHACLRNGDTVVPLNVQLSTDELTRQVARTDLDGFVCDTDTELRALSIADCPVASLDRPTDESVTPLFESGDRPAVEPSVWGREDTALVLFTSGTTGEPKAVRLTLGNLVASATASAFRLGTSPADSWLCCLPTYHMGGLAPILRTVLYGTTLVVQQSFDTTEMAAVLEEYGITDVSLVPTQLHRLLESGWDPPSSLDTVLLGGAPASAELLDRARARDVPVYPTYGLTETASQVATATPTEVDSHPETVGHPLLFTEITIVDERGEPAESGETGELVVDGPTVTPGYLDDAKTAEAFGEYGLYTGDVGYRDDDGKLWILGRGDDMILTGGENVDPTEVAGTLRSHSAITDAAVVGLADEEWGERVGALVVSADDSLTKTDVETYARERLASYKVPKTIEFVPELPRTASGTVDRETIREQLD